MHRGTFLAALAAVVVGSGAGTALALRTSPPLSFGVSGTYLKRADVDRLFESAPFMQRMYERCRGVPYDTWVPIDYTGAIQPA